MKCPVCKTELKSNDKSCYVCGFSKLNVEFVTISDATNWVEKVVFPFRKQWEMNQQSADDLYDTISSKQLFDISHEMETIELFDFDIDIEGIVITEYRGNASHVTIPNRIDGIKVYKLGNDLFRNCKELTSIDLPNELKIIGDRAFLESGLLKIDFPNKLEKIGKLAFSNTKINDVVLPASLKHIGWRAFSYDYFSHGLSTVRLNEGLDVIESEAFMNTNITEIIFPKSLKVIPKMVCWNCEKLKTVIVLGAEIIEDEAFSKCKHLEKVSLCDGLTTIKAKVFSGCSEMRKIIIPVTVNSVESNAILLSNYNSNFERHIAILNDNIQISGPGWNENIIFCRIGSSAHLFGRHHNVRVQPLNEFDLTMY